MSDSFTMFYWITALILSLLSLAICGYKHTKYKDFNYIGYAFFAVFFSTIWIIVLPAIFIFKLGELVFIIKQKRLETKKNKQLTEEQLTYRENVIKSNSFEV